MIHSLPSRLRRWVALGAATASVATVASVSQADEGQWPVDELSKLDFKQFSGVGLRLTPEQLWNAEGGLARASVNVSGCSAAFVSKEGLIVTNHHCAYRAIQSQSSPEKNLIQDGFLAKKRDQELEAKGYTVRVMQKISDVTADIETAANRESDDAKRSRAIDLRKKELVKKCEEQPSRRCDVATFYLGKQYKLFEMVELRDVRLVYAPPTAVGEYGGEIDNWMWPRHTGDFAVLRAYAKPDQTPAEPSPDNVPFLPKVHLPLSADGVRPGQMVMVMGYPGQTNRHLPRPEVERQVDQVLPGIVSLYGDFLQVLRDEAAKDKATAIKVAALEKSLANRHKNSRGMLEGIERMKLRQRREQEQKLLDAEAKKPERDKHAAALADVAKLAEERRETHARELLLSASRLAPNLLALGLDLARLARQKTKPDLERVQGFQERDLPALERTLERRVRDFDPAVDARLVAILVARSRDLAEGQRIAAFDKIAPGQKDPEAIARTLLPRFAASRLAKADEMKRLFDGDAALLEKTRDPILDLGKTLALEFEAQEELDHARGGRLSRSGPLFFQLLEAVRKGPVYPDANGTLRVSFAKVGGYSPRDGLMATPQTTLLGAVAKHTGVAPFDLPLAVRQKADTAKNSYWADPELGDVPVCFLSNADTTGGNSGSPIVDGNGKLVGLNFDRVWENIAGDFGYSTERSRNIGVDIRYMLWLLDRVDNASALLRELGVSQHREQPVRRSAADSRPAPAPRGDAPEETPKDDGGCSMTRARGPGPFDLGVALLLGALSWCRRRRKTLAARTV